MKAIQLSLFKPSNQLDFYCKDGYFTAYDEDARLAAEVCGIGLDNTSDRDSLTISLIRQADTFLPRLVRAGFKIKMIGL